MDIVAKLVGLLGDKFLPVVTLTAFLILGGYVWTLSGASTLRSVWHLASFRRLYELGYSRPRKRHLVAAAVVRSVSPRALFNPVRWFRDDDISWLYQLWERFRDQLKRYASFDDFFDDTVKNSRDLPRLMRSISAGAGEFEFDDHARRIDAAIRQTTRSIDVAADIGQVRKTGSSRRRKERDLVAAFLRDRGTLRACQALALELVDYVGRGTSLGLLFGVLAAGEVDLLRRIAIGTVAGGGLAVILWQRTLLKRFAGGAIDLGWNGPQAVRRLAWVWSHPGVSVCSVYAFAYAVLGLSVLGHNAISVAL